MATKKTSTDEEMAIMPVASVGPELISMGKYSGVLGEYELFGVNDGEGNASPLVETEGYKLAVVRHPSGQVGFAKVATDSDEARAALDKEARILRTLRTVAQRIDEQAEAKGKTPPYHGAFMPTVAEIIDEDKFVLLLGYHPSIKTFQQLKPLSLITADAIIDLKSATWAMGKLMKTLSYVHALGFAVGRIDASNILLEIEVHGCIFFDFTDAIEEATEEQQRADVVALVSVIWNATGGTETTPPVFQESIMDIVQHGSYCSVLSRIKSGDTDGAESEHKLIYTEDSGLADMIWPRREKTEGPITILKRDFHPFVTYPRE